MCVQLLSCVWFFATHGMQYVCIPAAAAKLFQSCPTLRHHREKPTRFPRPWDSPGKNTGVGCHFLLQCMKVKLLSLSDPVDCSLPGSSIHGIFQARVLEWGAIAFSIPFPTAGDFPNLKVKPASPASLLHCRQILYCWATRHFLTIIEDYYLKI